MSVTSPGVLQLVSCVSQDGSGSAGLAIDEDECRTVDAVVPLPIDAEIGVGFFDVDGLGLSVPGQLRGEPVLPVKQPGIRSVEKKIRCPKVTIRPWCLAAHS